MIPSSAATCATTRWATAPSTSPTGRITSAISKTPDGQSPSASCGGGLSSRRGHRSPPSSAGTPA
jgi:hypothetical protein